MDSLKFLHAWRGRTKTSIVARCLMPAALGMLFAVGSLAAGIFSSYVVTNTDLEVLVGAASCRMLNYTAYQYGNAAATIFGATVDSDTRSFAQRCYTPGPLPSQCNFYIRPRIEPTLSHVDCPFDSRLCINGTQAAVLDSGLLDSNDVLGINAAPRDRVMIRRKTTCAPLDTASHIKLLSSDDPIVVNFTGESYPADRRNIIAWWALLFGAAPVASDNVTGIHGTLPAQGSRTYEYKYGHQLA